MLTMIDARSNQGDTLELPLHEVSSGYIVERVEGLDPVKATISTSNFAGQEGVLYQSSRREARNIILTLGLEPNNLVGSVQQLRSALYNFFMPKLPVSLGFHMSDGLTVYISGRVESFESELFTKDPTVTISIMCFNPDFYEETPIVVKENTTSGTGEISIDYMGSVETGLLLTIIPSRALGKFSLFARTPGQTLEELEFITPLAFGNVLAISTVARAKGAELTVGAGTTSVLYGIAPDSIWVTLKPGKNYIRVHTEGTPMPYTIQYTNKYGGL